MAESETPVRPRLWTREGFVEEEWLPAESADALDLDIRIILPLDMFLGLDPQRRMNSSAHIGVSLKAGEALETLLPHLDMLALVALDFPAFTDGRSYSKAELLRGRHHYRGDIRATGDVLFDQIPHMLRCGFSTIEVSNGPTLRRLKDARHGGLALHTQPASAGPDGPGRFSWRRVPA